MRLGFARGCRQRRGRRLQRRDTVGHGRQHALDALTKPRNGLIDDRAARCLLAQQRVLPLCLAALGDVVMGADPIIAARNSSVDDRNGAAVGQFGHETHDLSGRHALPQFGAILFGIADQAAGLGAVRDNLHQQRAGLHDIGGQPINRQISIVANHETAGMVKHHHALGHVIDRQVEKTSLVIEPASREPHATQQQGGRKPQQKANKACCGDQPPIVRRCKFRSDSQHRVARRLAGRTRLLNR